MYTELSSGSIVQPLLGPQGFGEHISSSATTKKHAFRACAHMNYDCSDRCRYNRKFKFNRVC